MNRDVINVLEGCLYTTTKPKEPVHRCAVVLDKNRAISVRHGDHGKFTVGQSSILYSVVHDEIEVKVCFKL